MKLLLIFASCLVFAVETAEAKDNEVVSWIIDSSTNSEVDLIAEKLKKIKVTPYVLFNAKNAKGIEMRSRLPHLQQWMKEKIKSEYNINIEVAFKLLGNVGELLRISYAGCKGYSCQVAVSKVHSNYQDMIYDSARVSNFFVRTTLRALKYHKFAEKYINKDRAPKALRWVQRCAPLADKLVLASTKMVKQSEQLKNMTVDAFLETQQNDVQNTGQIKKTKERNNRLTARIESINKMLDDLLKRERQQKERVQKLDGDLKAHEQEYQKVKGRAVKTNEICKTDVVQGFGIPGVLTTGQKVVRTCHTELDKGDVELKKGELTNVVKKINKVRENQLELLQIKNLIQKNMTSLYGELAASVKGLGHTVELGNDLLRAQRALQMAIDTLGIVKTIFLNNRHYWIQVTHNAKQQGSSGDTTIVLKDLDEEETMEFKELLMESGFNWLALGKVSRDAMVAMIKVKKDVDKTFINLPSHDQAKQLIANSQGIVDETKRLIEALAEVNQVTEKEIEDAKKKIQEESGETDEENEDEEEEEEEEEEEDDDLEI